MTETIGKLLDPIMTTLTTIVWLKSMVIHFKCTWGFVDVIFAIPQNIIGLSIGEIFQFGLKTLAQQEENIGIIKD